MNKPRVLIVDDEPLARERLLRLLQAEQDVEVVGECGDGEEAIARLRGGGVDVLFLDMEMPGANGLEVLRALPLQQRPAVIFATAHESFALDAFEVQAVDYLLKPFDQERFQTALQRAQEYLRARHAGETEERLEALLDRMSEREQQQQPQPPKTERLTFKVDGRMVFLKPDEIRWVEAADNYIVLHLNPSGRHMVRETLTALEKRLDPEKFLRVNRSSLVHQEQVKELQPNAHGDYTLVLVDGTRLPLSRSLRGKLRDLFGN